MDAYPPATRHLVLRLLAQGLSHKEVARKLKIGVATVCRINRGQVRPNKALALTPTGDDLPPGYDAARLRRCPGCGHQVYLWPCLQCELDGRIEFPAEFRPAEKVGKKLLRQRGRPRKPKP